MGKDKIHHSLFVLSLISEIEFSLVIGMFKIRKGRSNHAEEAEEKSSSVI